MNLYLATYKPIPRLGGVRNRLYIVADSLTEATATAPDAESIEHLTGACVFAQVTIATNVRLRIQGKA